MDLRSIRDTIGMLIFFTKLATGLHLVNGTGVEKEKFCINQGFDVSTDGCSMPPRRNVRSTEIVRKLPFRLETSPCEQCGKEDKIERKNGSIFTDSEDNCVLSLRSWMYADLYHVPCRGGTSSAPSSFRGCKQLVNKPKDQDQNDTAWKQNIKNFERRRTIDGGKGLSKPLRTFYKQQDKLIESYVTLIDKPKSDDQDASDRLAKRAVLYSKITFFANVILLIAKMTAAILSGSIAIISSLVDSVVDLASGIVIWVTSRAIRKGDPYVYPQGKKRLEPLAIVILSVIMGVASLQLVKEAVTKIIGLANFTQSPPIVDLVTIGISIGTVVIKFGLYLLCKRVNTPSVQALAQDHRNDVVSNSLAVVCGYLGSKDFLRRTGIDELKYIDPIGAIFISLYIAVTWYIMGRDQTKVITGLTANPEFLSKITWICLNHHRHIRYVTSVNASHSGYSFVVEVSILLPGDMSLREVHVIGDSLKSRLESMTEVDKAFVHMDCTQMKKSSELCQYYENVCTHL